MKIRPAFLAGILLSILLSKTQGAPSPPTTGTRIIARGPHHRVVEHVRRELSPDGRDKLRTISYTELATGMHYWDDDWRETVEEIRVIPGGGLADRGPHKLWLAANVNSVPAVELSTPDQKVLRTRVLGLAYYDPVTGKSELIGELRDSIGELLAPNQVIYRDCFDGVTADVRMTYTRAGCEQDIILREQLDPPQAYNLSERSRIQVWTELFDLPAVAKHTHLLYREENAAIRAGMADPDFKDEALLLGSMRMSRGKAFSIQSDIGGESSVDVVIGKELLRIDRRDFLVESADYQNLQPLLDELPLPQQARRARPRQIQSLDRVALVASFRHATPDRQNLVQMVRAVARQSPGVVLDYSLVAAATNFTFKGDATYLVLSDVNLSGATTFEGGCVIKYTNGTAAINIASGTNGTVAFLTDSYRPVTFTAMSDNTIGQTIASSTGNPNTNFHGSVYLTIDGTIAAGAPIPALLKHVRFAHANTAVKVSYGTGHSFSHAQFVRCRTGLQPQYCDIRVRNALFYNVLTNAHGTSATGHWEHVTSHLTQTFHSGMDLTSWFTNCLFALVTNSFFSQGVGIHFTNSSSAFASAGAGAAYLAPGSPFRNIGTTNITSSLLGDLRQRTTVAPVILSNLITANTVLGPQAERDADPPDIGYHYTPLDYITFGCMVSNSVLVVTNGAALAVIGWPVLHMMDNSSLISDGSPIKRNHFGRCNAVQEQSIVWGSYGIGSMASVYPYPSFAVWAVPKARFRFTDFDVPSGSGAHLYTDDSWRLSPLSFVDCEFYGGEANIKGISADTIGVTNNLFFRTYTYHQFSAQLSVYNNLFYGGTCIFDRYSAAGEPLGDWFVKNNSFDGVSPEIWFDPVTHSHNAYINATQLPAPNTGDVVLTNFSYATGPLGRFYQLSTNLINKGSLTNAGLMGLYHYTTTTNQVKETNSVLDLGYHYIAMNAQGQPLDSDSDGLPDHLEDADGDGIVDSGEPNFLLFDTDGDGISDYLEWLQGRNPRAGAVNDTNGAVNLRVFTPLK